MASITLFSGRLVKLRKISLKYNQLNEIPGSLAKCIDTEELNIENNTITKLDQNIFDNLTKLQRVVISRNSFTGLPIMNKLILLYSFNGMQIITYMSLVFMSMCSGEYNCIDSLDCDVFAANSRLTMINLKSNKINCLPLDLSIWSHIKEINLGSNRIIEIPDSMGSLTNCEDLKLSNNKIR